MTTTISEESEKDIPVAFDRFVLDPLNASLSCDTKPISLAPKAFSVLKYLVDRRGRLVIKDELLDALWPDSDVCDAVLKVCVLEIRKVLEDDHQRPRFIQTVHRRGYRFIADVSPADRRKGGMWTERRGPSRLHSVDRLQNTPIVGREHALQTLSNRWEKALGGERQLVFISGEPGIGKTALIKAFLHKCVRNHVRVAWGECLEHRSFDEAYSPVLQALGQLCHDRRRAVPLTLLHRYAPTWLVELPWLIGGLDRNALCTGINRERMRREMSEALAAFCRETPVILVLEDLHWSDDRTLDLISFTGRQPDPARLLMLASYGGTKDGGKESAVEALSHEMQIHNRCTKISLRHLSKKDVTAFLRERLPHNKVSENLVRILYQRTGGNPVFLVNFVDEVLIPELSKEESTLTEARVEKLATRIPVAVQSIVERQLSQFAFESQQILEAASVVGPKFSAGTVAWILDKDTASIDDNCFQLSRNSHFIRPYGTEHLETNVTVGRYRFRYGIYRSVIYNNIALARRALLLNKLILAPESNGHGRPEFV